MKIYEMTHNSGYEPEESGKPYPAYAWASSYGPLDRMFFWDEISDAFKASAIRSWELNDFPPGVIIDTGGRIWPDFLGHGGTFPKFFVSENVIHDLESHGIPVWRKTEMPIAKIPGKSLNKLPVPRYFVLEASRGILIDYAASGVRLDAQGMPQLGRGERMPELKLQFDSWNGTDLFSDNIACGGYLHLMCTSKVHDLARQCGWTNVLFKERLIL